MTRFGNAEGDQVKGTDETGVRWRGGFGRIWGSIAVSLMGTQVSLLALPLTALVALDASPSQVALLAAAGTAPFLVFGLQAGAWVDRWSCRLVPAGFS